MPRICLSAIVKDEEAVIERMLDSVLPICDMAVIVDTGSTDGTEAAIRRSEAKHGKSIRIISQPWVDFSTNRNQALAEARDMLQDPEDYILVMDADDVLRPCNMSDKPLTADGYIGMYHLGDLTWGRVILIKAGVSWAYYYPVHEMLLRKPNDDISDLTLSGLVVDCNVGGAYQGRERFLSDAALLEAYMKEHPDCGRSQFYLAQSYECAGEKDKAIVAYAKRTQMEGYPEEKLTAWLRLGFLSDDPGALLEAAALNDSRAEGYYGAALWAKKKGMLQVAAILAVEAFNRRDPRGMFLDSSVYRWRAAALVAELLQNAELAQQVVNVPGAEYSKALLDLAQCAKPVGKRPGKRKRR